LNYLLKLDTCPHCGSALIEAEFGTSESDESTEGWMCEEECGYEFIEQKED
jgi:hypothetical protein